MEHTRKSGIKLNANKCVIKTTECKFFDLLYTPEGVKPNPDKVKALTEMHPPGTRKELRIFLGLVNYMGPFIPNLADHTASLRELLREDVEYSWSPSHTKVFNTTISLIAAQTTPAYYDQKQPVILQVDALTKGLGATLVQNGRPIAFASKALTPAETRFANIERELLAVMYGCEKFHTYLYGRRFKVESDHRPPSAHP